MRRTRPLSGAPPAPGFIPALLLALALGAALAARPAPGGAPAARGSAAAGAGIVVPGGGTGGGEAKHHTASARPVGEQLAARADDVAFCVGSTLEPFDAAWAQLLTIGPGEAAERTRRCLMELVFTHVDPAMAANIRALVPAFAACFGGVLALPDPTQQLAIAAVTTCLVTLADSPW